ncbi:MAG: YgaP family membrane protein [Microbacteriaceae bacterium]
MSRTERMLRVIIGIFSLSCAGNMPNLWLMVPAYACAGMLTLSGVLGWCPPIFGQASVPEHNIYDLPDARSVVKIDL